VYFIPASPASVLARRLESLPAAAPSPPPAPPGSPASVLTRSAVPGSPASVLARSAAPSPPTRITSAARCAWPADSDNFGRPPHPARLLELFLSSLAGACWCWCSILFKHHCRIITFSSITSWLHLESPESLDRVYDCHIPVI
jgi:hypothetical protein